MNELRKAAITAHEKYATDDIEVMNYDDEESFVERVEGGFWVEARVWVDEEEIATDEPRFWWTTCGEEYGLVSNLQPPRPVFGICDEKEGGYIAFTTSSAAAEDITRLLAEAYDEGR